MCVCVCVCVCVCTRVRVCVLLRISFFAMEKRDKKRYLHCVCDIHEYSTPHHPAALRSAKKETVVYIVAV